MAKKLDIDWKNLLLQKGEKIGFGVAIALMALFMVFGVKGMFSGSPSANAKAIEDVTNQKKQLLASNKPRDMNQFEVPPDLMTTQATLDPVDPNKYTEAVAYYIPFVPEDTKRREPKIEKPVDVVVQYVPAQIKSLMYDKEFKRIYVVQNKKGSKQANSSLLTNLTGRGGPGGKGGGMTGAGGGMGGGPGGGMMQQMMVGQNNPAQQRSGGRQQSRSMQVLRDSAFGPGGARGSDDKGGKGLALIKIEELEKSDAQPAERVLPSRMVLIVGAFPLRKQLEDLKSALHSPTLGEALRELHFEGVEFERREIGPDGKPIGDFAATNSDGIRFDDYLRTVFRLCGKREAEEDETMAPLIIRGLGLVYKLPAQFEGRKYPGPESEALKKTLESIKEKGVVVEVDRSGEVNADDLLADSSSSQQTTTGAAGGTGLKPAGGASGAATAKGGVLTPRASDSSKEDGTMGKGAKSPLAGPEGGNTGTLSANWEPPEYCLIRFFDLSVDPGKTYEYRYRLKMKNPNKGHDKEVAWPELAKKEWVYSAWFELPQRVTIPADFHYYAVDMKELPEYAKAPNIRGQAWPLKDQVAFQLHRWVDRFATPDSGQPEAVGDWAVKDRVLFYRGEFVGGLQSIELPRWNSEDEQFEIAADPRDRRPKPVQVPFTESDSECPILLDSWGGTVTYKKPGESRRSDIEEKEIPREVLLLSPEGRLFVRNSVNDAKDPQREAHFQEWKKRVEEVKDQGNVKKQQKAGEKANEPAGPFGKGGGKQ